MLPSLRQLLIIQNVILAIVYIDPLLLFLIEYYQQIDQVFLNEFKQVAHQIISANTAPGHGDGFRKIEAALISLQQQIGVTKTQGTSLDLNEEHENNDVWHYSLIGIIILLIGAVVGYGVSALISSPKTFATPTTSFENATIKEISSNQKDILNKLDQLLKTEKPDLKSPTDDEGNLVNSKINKNN